jgi:hypothetical protein
MTANSESSRSGEPRRADPNAAAQDPENAARQRQVAADHDALQSQAQRTAATTSADVRATSAKQGGNPPAPIEGHDAKRARQSGRGTGP